ncbi:MAG: helix-turn-helix transcriptional regulator [Bacteroidetes bacterium]|nr:helix-turn-helix transcriptional regulator [Bacteroidota bacterium]
MFKQELGISPGKYVLKIKMDKVCQFLGERNISIQEVGFATGYDDIAHFYRAFKNYTKMTPKEYRRKYFPIG